MNELSPKDVYPENSCKFEAILEELARCGKEKELERIQLECLQLLAYQSERFTNGESSSVRTETAQDILQSIFYTLAYNFTKASGPAAELETLASTSLTELYQTGKQVLLRQLSAARTLLNAVQRTALHVGIIAYKDTLFQGIPEFFSVYETEFSAHQTPGSIDYPLCVFVHGLTGVQYIHQYLLQLYFENLFCNKISTHEICCVLRTISPHYHELLLNIYQTVLTNAIGYFLCHNSTGLILRASDKKRLSELLDGLTEKQLISLFQKTVERLCASNPVKASANAEYLLQSAEVLAKSFYFSPTKSNDFFVFIKKPPASFPIYFEDSAPMENQKFQSLTDEVRACRYFSDKLTIISQDFKSIADLTDLLDSESIMESEFYILFSSLPKLRLALLLQQIPSDMEHDLDYLIPQRPWQAYLLEYIKTLPPEQARKISQLASNIRFQ